MQREIEGYASATSVNRGDYISLYVNTDAATFDLEVFRMGWYQGLGARRVFGPIQVGGQTQIIATPDPETGLVDNNWVESYALETRDGSSGEAWATGIYLARLTESDAGKQSYILFVVRDDSRQPDILYQLPVTTYQAYNYWGGRSLYDWGSGSAEPWGSQAGRAADKVSFNRPYATSIAAGFNSAAAVGAGAGEFLTNVQRAPTYPISSAGWDYNLVRWLERVGYDVGYITNLDTHRFPQLLVGTDVFLSSGHDEYWSWQMMDNVEAARNVGINLAFLSSNTAYWNVRFESSPATGQADRVMVAYKDKVSDPFYNDGDSSNDNFITVRFRQAPLNRPEERLLGVQYILDPFDGDIIVTNPTHWIFEGTGLSNQSRLPGLLGYEPDGRFGDEPSNTVTLATTPVVSITNPSRTGTSHMTLYSAASGAQVFATGSMQWSWGLDDYNWPALRTSRYLPTAQIITRNVFQEFGAVPSPKNSVSALCVRLVALSEIDGGPWASAAEIEVLDAASIPLSKLGWTLSAVDSEELNASDGSAVNAFDISDATIWHTEWQNSEPTHPHFIDIKLSGQQQITGLEYLPRQDGSSNGTISQYEIYTSLDCVTWKLAADGIWARSTDRKSATFD
jgi:hypothetical protein